MLHRARRRLLMGLVVLLCPWIHAQQAPASPKNLLPQLEKVDWSASKELYPGIRHQQWTLTKPRRMVVNCLRVDAQAKGIRFHCTGRIKTFKDGIHETERQTVRNFIRTERARGNPMVVAINADAFSLKSAFDRQDPCDLNGLAIADGVLVSKPANTPSLLITRKGEMRIETVASTADLSTIHLAVSGFGLCLENGVPRESGKELHPRTGFGLSKDRRFLFLMTIDGRQLASAGATVHELGVLMEQAGCTTAINMDGGGSTTMAWWNPKPKSADHCELLNFPVGNGSAWPTKLSGFTSQPFERTNGNNFGVSFTEESKSKPQD